VVRKKLSETRPHGRRKLFEKFCTKTLREGWEDATAEKSSSRLTRLRHDLENCATQWRKRSKWEPSAWCVPKGKRTCLRERRRGKRTLCRGEQAYRARPRDSKTATFNCAKGEQGIEFSRQVKGIASEGKDRAERFMCWVIIFSIYLEGKGLLGSSQENNKEYIGSVQKWGGWRRGIFNKRM